MSENNEDRISESRVEAHSEPEPDIDLERFGWMVMPIITWLTICGAILQVSLKRHQPLWLALPEALVVATITFYIGIAVIGGVTTTLEIKISSAILLVLTLILWSMASGHI